MTNIQTERTYNAISPQTARRMVRKLRRLGYQVKQNRQWIMVLAETLDMEVSQVARFYEAIAY